MAASIQALFDAIKDNKLKDVQNIFSSGSVDVNQQDSSKGFFPLYVASTYNKLRILNFLINHGADVNKMTSDGFFPLFVASSSGHVDIVKALINADADVNKMTSSGGSFPLYAASEEGHIEVVKTLIEAGADVNKMILNGYFPLHAASREGHIEVVKALIDAGANVNKITPDGTSFPLYVASYRGHIEVVQTLINAGADVNRYTSDASFYFPLFVASAYGHLDIVNALIDAGADVNKITSDGSFPLYVASREGYIEVINTLIEAGADLNMKFNGKDMFEYAEYNTFSPEINEYILSFIFLRNTRAEPLATNTLPKNAPSKCFDPIMANNTNITNEMTTFYIIDQEGRIATSCLDTDSLETYKINKDYLFYRCKDTVPISALFIQYKNVLPAPIRLLNFQMRIYVKDSQAQSLQPGKKYVLRPIEDLGRIVSYDVLTGGTAVSSVHCGPSDGSKLYDIKEINETITVPNNNACQGDHPSQCIISGGKRKKNKSYKNKNNKSRKIRFKRRTVKKHRKN
jgi:ankyrin repeat protein